MLRLQMRRGRSEVIALHQIGVRVGRAERLGFGLDSFHAYERARLVQHRDDPANMRRASGSTVTRRVISRSILTMSGFSRQMRSKLEYPAPKSSITMRQPIVR